MSLYGYLLSVSPTEKVVLVAHSEKKVGVGGRFQPKSPPTRWSTAAEAWRRAPMKRREARKLDLVEPMYELLEKKGGKTMEWGIYIHRCGHEMSYQF